MKKNAVRVASHGYNRLEITGVGKDEQACHRMWDGQKWSPAYWQPLGAWYDGSLGGLPLAVASWGPDRLDWFSASPTGMSHKAWTGSAWWPPPTSSWGQPPGQIQTGWEGMGGTFASAPAVASWGHDRLDIFAVNARHMMVHKAWTGTAWWPAHPDWEYVGGESTYGKNLDGVFRGPPAVASWGPDRLDIFALNSDGMMLHKAWTGSAWWPSQIGWEPMGKGIFTSPPTVVSWGPNRLDIFGIGTDYAMYHRAWTGSAWWPSPTEWEHLGVPPQPPGVTAHVLTRFEGPPAVASWGPNRLDIFALDDSYTIHHKAWTGSAWWPSQTGWEPLGRLYSSPPAVTSWGPDRLDIFAIGTDKAMHHKAWTGSAWWPAAQEWESMGGVFADFDHKTTQ